MFSINFHNFSLRNKIITIIILTFFTMGGFTLVLLHPNILNPLLEKQIVSSKNYFQNLTSNIKESYKKGYYSIDKNIASKEYRTFLIRIKSNKNSVVVADNRDKFNLEGTNFLTNTNLFGPYLTNELYHAKLDLSYSKLFNVSGINYLINYYKFLSTDIYRDQILVVSIYKIDYIFKSVNTIFLKVLSIIVIYSIFIILILILFIDYLLNPLNKLKNGLIELNKGKLGYEINIDSGDELENIGSSFNTMSKYLLGEDTRKKEFIQNVSHELKTPIAGIKTMSQLIMVNCDNEENLEYLNDIDHEINRINNVINDLLVLEEVQNAGILHTEVINTESLILDSTSNLKRLAYKKGINLEFDIESFDLDLDTLKFERVIINLLDNAIKYSDSGSNVSVSCKKNLNFMVLKIKDNGIGIPEESLNHIFTRFYRVDKARSRKTGGTGLGLSIVKEIVELHHGTISVESQENLGTTFTIQIPIKSGIFNI